MLWQKVTKVVILVIPALFCPEERRNRTREARKPKARTDERLDRRRLSAPLINLEVECGGRSLTTRETVRDHAHLDTAFRDNELVGIPRTHHIPQNIYIILFLGLFMESPS